MDVKQVGVIGAGTMGNGIAHVFARSGYDVVLCDIEQRFLDRGLQTIDKNLEREVAKGKITAEEKAAALQRISPLTDRAKLASCDFIVEAATEKFEIKAEMFRELDKICRPEVILASNTSSISITKLAALTKRAGQSDRDALFQSGAGDEAGGSDSRAGDFAGDVSKRCETWRSSWRRRRSRSTTRPASFPTACSCRCSTKPCSL